MREAEGFDQAEKPTRLVRDNFPESCVDIPPLPDDHPLISRRRDKPTAILVHGNHKLDCSIGIFDVLQGSSCPGKTEVCTRICYTRGAYYRWPSIATGHYNRISLSKRDDFVEIVVKEIAQTWANKGTRMQWVRVHSYGDFYDQRYVDLWFEVARRHPRVTFLAYTHSHFFDYSKRPPNFILYYSVDPDMDDRRILRGFELVKSGVFAGFAVVGWRDVASMPRAACKAKECPGHCGPTGCLWCYEGRGDVRLPVHSVPEKDEEELYAEAEIRELPRKLKPVCPPQERGLATKAVHAPETEG